MRKIYDPEKMKEQVKAEIASRRKEEKRGVKSYHHQGPGTRRPVRSWKRTSPPAR